MRQNTYFVRRAVSGANLSDIATVSQMFTEWRASVILICISKRNYAFLLRMVLFATGNNQSFAKKKLIGG